MELSDLYSEKILDLAGNAPQPGRLADADASARKVSRVCGSMIEVDIRIENGVIVGYGHEVSACALGQASAAVVARAERAQRRDADIKRQAWLQAAAALAANPDTSLMEIRMTGSLKSIRDQAEQGLVASDAEKSRHLAAIWSMAACDLDDDPDQVAH